VSLGFTRNRRQTFSVTLLRDGDPLIEATQMLDLASSGGGGVYSSPRDPVEGPRAPTVKIGASSPPSFRSTSSAGSVRGRASWAAPFQFSLSPAAAARSTRSESPTIQMTGRAWSVSSSKIVDDDALLSSLGNRALVEDEVKAWMQGMPTTPPMRGRSASRRSCSPSDTSFMSTLSTLASTSRNDQPFTWPNW